MSTPAADSQYTDEEEYYEEEEDYDEGYDEEEEEDGENETEGGEGESQGIIDGRQSAESWNSKIAEAAGNLDMNRATTPLRPDAGLVARIENNMMKVKATNDAMAASKRLMVKAKSTRTAKQAAAEKEKRRIAATKQLELDSMKKNFPTIDSARSHHGELPPGDDPYSLHEKDIVTELNLVRANPAQYAKLISMVFLIGHPFLPASIGKVNYAKLQEFIATTTTEVKDLTEALGSLEESEKKEIQVLKDQWAIEDAEKNKKKGKGGAAAKGKGKEEKAAEEAAAAAALEAERSEAVQAIVDKNSEQRNKLNSELSQASTKRDKAALGQKHIDHCMSKLEQMKTMTPHYYNRGLSLAARDVCSNTVTSSGPQPHTIAEVEQLCLRYGSLVRDDSPTEGPATGGAPPTQFSMSQQSAGTLGFGQTFSDANAAATAGSDIVYVLHRGNDLVRQTVMEMLLCFEDPKKTARHRMLGPNPCFVGAGWRRDVTGGSLTCLLFSTSFEELEAISIREHMSLQDIRRILGQATALTSKTVLRLRSPQCSMVSPTAHPVVCSNTAIVTIRCPLNLAITAALHSERDVVPKQPGNFGGEIFIQRSATDATLVEIHVLLPHKARFGLAIFSREESGSGGGVPLGGVASMGYQLLGRVKLHADNWNISDRGSLACPSSYPLATSNFSERQANLVCPLEGTLTRDTPYTFEIVIPKTKYLTQELDRINSSLDKATRVASGSKEKGEELEKELQFRTEEQEAKQKERDERLPQLQTDLATLMKEQAKKRGKDLEKNKTAVADIETQIKQFDIILAELSKRKQEAEEKIVVHRRSIRQASAQRRRFLSEQSQLAVAADRTQPLMVEVSLDERRAKLEPIDDEATRYAGTVRAPKGGQVCLFIGGVATLTWYVR